MAGRATGVLAALVLALGATIAAELHLGIVDTSPVAPRPTDDAAVLAALPPPAPALPDLANLTETVDRPLFEASRRPQEAAPVAVDTPPAAAAVAEAPPALELTAVVIEADRRMALFQRGSGVSGSVRAVQGELLDGWTVAEVRADGVTLEKDGARHEIVLRTFKSPPSAARAGPGPVTRPAPAGGEVQKGDRPASAPAPVQRPRRPLRGPRQRSLQRGSSG